MDKCVRACAPVLALSFGVTNGSYLFLMKLFLNTNEVIYLDKNALIQSLGALAL